MTDTAPTPPAPDPAPPINVQQVLAELLHVGAKIDALNARKTELRATLEAEALRRWESDHAVPSWKVPRLGSATLAAVDVDPDISVTDDNVYVEWLVENYPTEVDQVVEIPGAVLARAADDPAAAAAIAAVSALIVAVPGVRFAYHHEPAFLKALVAGGRADVESGRLADANGVLVDGITVTAKRPYLSVRAHPEAKARARAELDAVTPPPIAVDIAVDDQFTDKAEAAAAVMATLAGDRAEDEGAGDAPPPEPAPDPAPAAPPEPAEGPERTSTITIGDPEPADGASDLAEALIAADRDRREP